MIALHDGWRRISTVGEDVAVSPDGRMQLRYRSRCSPIQKFAVVVDDTLLERPEWRTSSRGPVSRFATLEGEHAYGVTLEGEWDGLAAQRYIGVVYGDDTYNLVDAVALGTTSPLGAQAREWTRTASLQLGVRRRRFFYAKPARWHGHATGLVTHWFPPEFPSRPTTLVLYPANPTNEVPTAIYDALVTHEQTLGARVEPRGEPTTIVGRGGLPGLHWRMVCTSGTQEVHRDLVVFARRPYTYSVQLDAFGTVDADARETLLALALTVEAVPDGTSTPTPAGELDFL